MEEIVESEELIEIEEDVKKVQSTKMA